jgi:hypothetical protein
MSVSLQAWPDGLKTAASSTSLLPIGMQTPVTSIETKGARSTLLRGIPSLAATAVPLCFFLESGQSDKSDNFDSRISHGIPNVFLSAGENLAVY